MIRRLLVLLSLLFLSSYAYSEPIRVFASVLPIKTFVEKVGGEHVDVHVMVRPGFNPHTYDPTPQQISALASTVLYVRTGVPFEKAWMKRIRSANRNMQVLDVRDQLALRKMTVHAHEDHKAGRGHSSHSDHEDHHDEHAIEQDPHVWVDPVLVAEMIGRIRDKLIRLDPDNAPDYALNHDAYLAELKVLDKELQDLLEPVPNRKFIVFHPAWGYFADRYHLVQVPIEDQGKEAGARRIVNLIEQARHEKINVIFVQPQFDKRQADQVAMEISGKVIAVDPLAGNYVENLRRVGKQFAGSLK